MKIEIDKKSDKNYYDEIMYVKSYYRKIKINHKRKITKLSSEFIKYLILIFIFMILTILLYLYFKDTFYIYIIVVYGLLLMFDLYLLYTSSKKTINYINGLEDKETINITDTYVKHTSINSVYKINWEDMECILVNKYSICFIPKTGSSGIISVPIEYRHKVVETIKKYNKQKLLVINNHEK